MAKTCSANGCNNPIYSHSYCRIHQWLRKDDDYQRQREWAKKKKPISKESSKRKKEHLRYSEQRELFKAEKKAEGKYYCYICKGEFDQSTIDWAYNIHHTLGRTGDYYLDKQYWMLAHNKCHLELHDLPIEELKEKPYWDDFLTRLKVDYPDAYKKIQRQIEKSGELF